MMLPVVTANVWNRCQNRCEYCISAAPDRTRRFDDGRDFGAVLDVHALIRWIDKFRPDARVNVSGGEPLFYPGIEDWVQVLLDAGKEVTILTNGMDFHKRTRLHDSDVSWIVTYHFGCGLTPEQYAERIAPLKNRPRVKLQTVLVWDDEDVRKCHHLKEAFEGFNFSHRWVDDDGRTAREMRIPKLPPIDRLASYWINLVENDGNVYPCNTKVGGPVGNVYSLTYDEEKAKLRDERSGQCLAGQWCGAMFALNESVEGVVPSYCPTYTPKGMVA